MVVCHENCKKILFFTKAWKGNFLMKFTCKLCMQSENFVDNLPVNWIKCKIYHFRGHIGYLVKRTCTDNVGQIAYGFRTVSLHADLLQKLHLEAFVLC